MADGPRYPRYDLAASIDAARIVRAKSTDGMNVSQDELSQFLGYKSKANGAYITRLAALRHFGLLEGRGQELRLTTRAIDILEPDFPATADAARLGAFFDIELFDQVFQRYGGSNRELPDEPGMKNAMQNSFGVPEEQTGLALRILLDSAEEAGLFRVSGNRSKMIKPTIGNAHATPAAVTDKTPTPATSTTALAAPNVARTTGPRASKIVDGALDLLPADDWTETGLKQWLEFFENALRLYYQLPKPTPFAERVDAFLGGSYSRHGAFPIGGLAVTTTAAQRAAEAAIAAQAEAG